MSFDYTAWAWKQTSLPYLEKYTLLALSDYANDKGECWPSIGGLAEKMGYSRESRKRIRQALGGLEGRGLVSATGRIREGTKEQTTHLYRIHKVDTSTGEVGANNPNVGANVPKGGGYKPHESVTEPITEPITSPTPSPLRDEGSKSPSAIEQSSTPTEVNPDQAGQDQSSDTELRRLVHGMVKSSDYDYPVLAEQFIERFEEIHGTGRAVHDAGHLFWNCRYDEKLTETITKAQARIGDDERGTQYGIAQWLGTFTNHANS